MRPDAPRPSVAGADDGPEPPFPLRLTGKVIKGFGRGSKDVSGTLSPSFLPALTSLSITYTTKLMPRAVQVTS